MFLFNACRENESLVNGSSRWPMRVAWRVEQSSHKSPCPNRSISWLQYFGMNTQSFMGWSKNLLKWSFFKWNHALRLCSHANQPICSLSKRKRTIQLQEMNWPYLVLLSGQALGWSFSPFHIFAECRKSIFWERRGQHLCPPWR